MSTTPEELLGAALVAAVFLLLWREASRPRRD